MAGKEQDSMQGFYSRAPIAGPEVSGDDWKTNDERIQEDIEESIEALVRAGRISDLARLIVASSDHKLVDAVTRITAENRWQNCTAIIRDMPNGLLKNICAVPVYATEEPFVYQRAFVEGLSADGQILVRQLDGEFKTHFLGGVQYSESPISSDILICQEFAEDFPIASLVVGLGGKEKVKTNIAAMWATIVRQGLSQKGPLHVDWLPNHFLIPDFRGCLCDVTARWDNGWWFFAEDVRNETLIPSEARIFLPQQEPRIDFKIVQIGVTGFWVDGVLKKQNRAQS